MAKKIDRSTFCSLPFVHIANRIGGYFKACCHIDDVVVDSEGRELRTCDGDRFEDAFFTPYMESLRENLKSGVQDPRCKMCWSLEDRGIISKRIHDGDRYLDIALKRAQMDNVPFEPVSWDIKLGSLCNLRCRTCNGQTSSAILKEEMKHNEIDPHTAKTYLRESKDLLDFPHFRSELQKIAPFAQEIYFLGGEPTIMARHLELIDAFIDVGIAENVTIRWSTNLSHFDQKFIDRAKRFKNIILDCSVDGYGEVNDYIRDQSQWSQISAKAIQLKNDLPQANLKFICTVNIYNVWSLDRLTNWGEKNDIGVYYNFLDYPGFLSVKNLGTQAKQWLTQKYTPATTRREQELLAWLSGPGDTCQLNSFFEYTKKLDRRRNQNIEKILTLDQIELIKSDISSDLEKTPQKISSAEI